MFTDQMELLVISTAIRNDDVYKKISGVIDKFSFTNEMASVTYELVANFYKEYSKLPIYFEIINEYSREFRSKDNDKFVQFIDSLYMMESNNDYVISEINRYAKSRQLEKIFRENYEKVKCQEELDISSLITNLFKIQKETTSGKHLYGIGIDDSETILERGEAKIRVPTNIAYFNELINGGLAGGELGIILAPPNHGKTMLLLNFAIHAFLTGHNVLFITLEMDEFSILRRIIMIVSGAVGKEMSMADIKSISIKLAKKFMILYKPVRSITVDYICSVYHHALADGVKFDQIYIDYADLIKPSISSKDKRFDLANVFEGLKSMSQVLEVPVWSATQSNREGMKAETVKMEHMSEDISKAFTSDIILSLSDKMAVNAAINLFLTKNRQGKSDQKVATWVGENMWITDGDNATSNIGIGNV